MIMFASHLVSALRSLFVRGLFTLFPIITTIIITHAGYATIARWVAPLKKYAPHAVAHVPGVEFALVIIFIIIVGALLRLFIVAPIIHYGERLIDKIPLVRIVYSSTKILVDFFNMSRPDSEAQQVVLVPYPYKGCYHIAFLLGPAEYLVPSLPPLNPGDEYCKVFMPNSPNPTTGYFFILPRSEVLLTNLSFEDAIKATVSCGIYTPPMPPSIIVDTNTPQ